MDFNDYVNQGIAFFQKNEYGPAIENLKAAANLMPDNPEIRELIKMVEAKAGMEAQASQAAANEARQRAEAMGITDVDQAIKEYTEALKRSPNDASAKSNLASAYYIRGVTFTSKGDNARAIADYSNAIKYEPNYPFAFNKRGQAYLTNGDFDKAIADFEELIRLDPNNNGIKNNLANVYMQRGIEYDKKKDYTRAISDFEKVLKYKPDDNTARELLQMAKAEKAKQ
jgi:tetratricopeptide (TPR) repeat protein